jgi:hypothetical protein
MRWFAGENNNLIIIKFIGPKAMIIKGYFATHLL